MRAYVCPVDGCGHVLFLGGDGLEVGAPGHWPAGTPTPAVGDPAWQDPPHKGAALIEMPGYDHATEGAAWMHAHPGAKGADLLAAFPALPEEHPRRIALRPADAGSSEPWSPSMAPVHDDAPHLDEHLRLQGLQAVRAAAPRLAGEPAAEPAVVTAAAAAAAQVDGAGTEDVAAVDAEASPPGGGDGTPRS